MNHVSEINEYGDIRCPNCGLWIIAPAGYGYQAGTGLCKLCGGLFILTEEVAQRANARLDSRRTCLTGRTGPTIKRKCEGLA